MPGIKVDVSKPVSKFKEKNPPSFVPDVDSSHVRLDKEVEKKWKRRMRWLHRMNHRKRVNGTG